MENNAKSGEIAGDKWETKGIIPRGPFRSISMDEHYLYKTPYSFLRQNSINESRDYNELKDKKDKNDQFGSKSHGQIEIHNSAEVNANEKEHKVKAHYQRQKSKISATVEDLLLEEKSDTDLKMEVSEINLEKGDKVAARYDPRGKRICLYVVSGSSCLLSVLAVCLMMVVFFQVSINQSELREESATSMGFSHNHHSTSDVSAAGSFKLNQTYLHENKRIVWIKDEYSAILPSTNDDCLTVPYGGKYFVVSRFTFNIPAEDSTAILTHFFKLKTSDGQLKDGGFRRKYVSVFENKLRTNSTLMGSLELRKPSVFIEFFELDARDQICPNVSNPNLLYESKMDNDVNIIQVS